MTVSEAYAALGVRHGAAWDEVKAAYFALAKTHHPDVVDKETVSAEEAHATFLRLGEAYALLKDAAAGGPGGPGGGGPASSSSGSADAGEAGGSGHAWWNVWMRPGGGPGALLGKDSIRVTNDRWESHIRGSKLASKLDAWIFGSDANTLIEELVRERDLEAALAVFEHLKASPDASPPTQSTYAMLIRGCTLNMRRTGPDTDNEADPYTASLLELAKDLFKEMQTGPKYKPYESTIHEMIRAHGKAGDFDGAWELFDKLLFEKFVRPTNLVCNSMLEICLTTGHHAEAHKVLLILDGAKSLLKPLYKPDSRTFGLALKNSVDGGYFATVPEQLRILASNHLFPDPPTSERIVTAALTAGDVDAADAILAALDATGATALPPPALERVAAARALALTTGSEAGDEKTEV
ncbi:uncharacterized protein AMSG_07227 [Thecamonas trahens ATCC 50062]|uniref:J domain-containing protein n=1 Tax=Thecamonas trahens ATCC 50062 TaxID=461836 RepID=A0A0L0DFN2_THETB|nr:hypothetical protein AMSG_07227 [Thecamonas trahens ATCC 50062]KNC50971.1 hypothetical protein AMSG_07227 [Thecamonas trahens ATCC 50062]|eukprot:XP_013756666.1 hypothetical protein AMSG_07227 [Thecamonas trahens ATCC 50062]